MKTNFKGVIKIMFGGMFSFIRKHIKPILTIICTIIVIGTITFLVWYFWKAIMTILAFVTLGALCGGFCMCKK